MQLLQTITTIPKHVTALTLLSFVLSMSPLSSLAQNDTSSDELLSINMRDADIGAVIQWIAEQTNKKIVVDPRVKGRVTVLANQGMTTDQAYEVFLAMLDVHGYSATESGGILRIFPTSLAKTSPKELVDSYGQLSGGQQVMYVFTANKVSASRLAEILKPLLPSSGYLAAYPETNSLVIADDADNVKRMVAMIEKIDQSGDMEIESIKLKHADANNVAGLVQSLLGKEDGLVFSIASDERSNSLLMSGNLDTRRRVKNLIDQLDSPLAENGNTRVIYLHYLTAEELLPILRGMSDAIQKDNQNKDSTGTVSIEASNSSNALVMTAPPYILDMMSDVIEQVDIRRAQVLVEAIIVEVSKDFSQTLGVEWNTNLSSDDGVEALTNFGLRNNASIDADSGSVSNLLGAGLNLGFYRNGSLRAVAQAIAREGDTNVLSTPSILTLDNQEAEILVGSNVPFITGQSTGAASGTNNPFTTIERQDIGLTLKITPQINEGDAITLDILQEIETIAESTTVANDIVTNKRSIKTKVIVENDTILVLGGLVSDDIQELVNKVPVLGDIPLVGGLFRSTTDQVTKRNLMVFIHPVIVDSGEVAENVSKKSYHLMEELREKYSAGKFTVEPNELKDFKEYQPKNKNSSSIK